MTATKPSERFDSLWQVYARWDQRRDGTWFERAPALDWRLLKRQAVAESGLDPDAVSPVGAEGLSQFMRSTFEEWAQNEYGPAIPPNRHVSPFDPEDSVRAQCDLMSWLLVVWKGDMRKALAGYNAGIGRVKRLIDSHGDHWESFLPLETQTYMKKILDA